MEPSHNDTLIDSSIDFSSEDEKEDKEKHHSSTARKNKQEMEQLLHSRADFAGLFLLDFLTNTTFANLSWDKTTWNGTKNGQREQLYQAMIQKYRSAEVKSLRDIDRNMFWIRVYKILNVDKTLIGARELSEARLKFCHYFGHDFEMADIFPDDYLILKEYKFHNQKKAEYKKKQEEKQKYTHRVKREKQKLQPEYLLKQAEKNIARGLLELTSQIQKRVKQTNLKQEPVGQVHLILYLWDDDQYRLAEGILFATQHQFRPLWYSSDLNVTVPQPIKDGTMYWGRSFAVSNLKNDAIIAEMEEIAKQTEAFFKGDINAPLELALYTTARLDEFWREEFILFE